MDTVSSHADVAMRAGMSPARLSQVLTGRAPAIKLAQAARLEDVLEVPRGTFFAFEADEAELAADYLLVDVPEPAKPAEDRPARETDWFPVAGGEG